MSLWDAITLVAALTACLDSDRIQHIIRRLEVLLVGQSYDGRSDPWDIAILITYIKTYLLVYMPINFFGVYAGYSNMELREHVCKYLGN